MSDNHDSQNQLRTKPSMIGFDLDGTLISSYMENVGRDYHAWRVLPCRAERLAYLYQQGIAICICTNQAGVELGYVTIADLEQKFALVQQAFGVPVHFYACTSTPRSGDPRRKPMPGMLLEAQADHGTMVVFVGDRPEDEAAARAAGIPFAWAWEFFQ